MRDVCAHCREREEQEHQPTPRPPLSLDRELSLRLVYQQSRASAHAPMSHEAEAAHTLPLAAATDMKMCS